jgi:hypothetical protein
MSPLWTSTTAVALCVFPHSDSFKRALDRYCGLCITALYFLYLSVVKGALSVFDCSMNEDGVRILDADPSIVCDKVRCVLPAASDPLCKRGGSQCVAASRLGLRLCSRSVVCTPVAREVLLMNRGTLEPLHESLPMGTQCNERSLGFCAGLCCGLQPGGVQESLKPAAAMSIVLYTVGLPVAFLVILLKFRREIRADQALRIANDGHAPSSNPNFHIRKRYQELYK